MASLVKMTPELRMPEMNRLTYGQKVKDSTVQYEGNALYMNKDLLVETQVPGTFDGKKKKRKRCHLDEIMEPRILNMP